MKDDVRKDSVTAQFDVIRLMLTLVTFMSLRLGLVDISGAYMQSGPIRRQIYVRSPRAWEHTARGMIWELLKLPYGIMEAGRQWATVMEAWQTQDMGMNILQGVSQRFIKHGKHGEIVFILAKITDNLLFAGSNDAMAQFVTVIKNRFEVCKTILDGPMHFIGCLVKQDQGGQVTMDLTDYMQRIEPMELDRSRRKQAAEKAKPTEYNTYRSLAGAIIWAGNGALPHAV